MKRFIIILILFTGGCASSGTAYSTKGFSVGSTDPAIHINSKCDQAQQFLNGEMIGLVMFPADCVQ